ncbi:hypothetical protein WRSd3_p00042 (plasmid) [Shigella dysenteriae WRSd3]|uniref:Uncharacterized protein n=2 Tax=Shigella TaxID=620 RepID=B2TSP0_SHIB3|nr:hypothetical protein SbBS512_A0043 [Shigella boydii CDC 3083-94]ACD54317.1 hypothetical protein Ec53638_A0343 [Escherichia coli 53638]ESU75890.1 hypothetical protein WRSd3_p00042 [Shigella dysenteriae WRSd3]ESU76574.1 hypothetical protein WRSd5_p00021 [Shigella dysenteriae WRSd5]
MHLKNLSFLLDFKNSDRHIIMINIIKNSKHEKVFNVR